MTIRTLGTALGMLILGLGTGCRSTSGDLPPIGSWDPDRAEILEWSSSDPAYEQDHAMEASGLVGVGADLLATSEKYQRLIRIDTESLKVEVDVLTIPEKTELEGVTVLGGELLFCDEATAGLWSVDLDDDGAASEVPGRAISFTDIEVAAGKIGLEGITASGGGSDPVYVLLERSERDDGSCVSEIFPVHYSQGRAVSAGETLVVPLEDCNWRLTGLEWWHGRLYALKTRFPGEQYELVIVDLDTGLPTKILDLTLLLTSVTDDGWHNNVEGLAFTPDGALWLISDNAMTGTILDFEPALADRRTLLMRIPPHDG